MQVALNIAPLNARFQQVYDKIERQRADLLKHVEVLSPEEFNRQPAPGKWSVAQILTHILVSEQLSIGYMKKKSQGIEQLGDSGISASVRSGILKISQRIPALKFRAPKVVVSKTPEALSFPLLVQQWNGSRHELKALFESIEGKHVRKLIYKHPFAGRLDAAQAALFFYEHLYHHWPQIKRLLPPR